MMIQTSDSLISRADLLYAKGRCDEAVDLLTDSLARDPSQGDVATRLAEFLIDSGWHARALEFLKDTDADENNGWVLLLRGRCHEALGNFACADDLADQLLTQDRQRANALALKARVAVGSQEIDKAERLFQEAIVCDPGCGMAWYGRACLRRQQGDIQAHHTFIEKAFLALPQSKEISIAFHENGLATGDFPQIESVFREALARQPMNRRLHFFLIDILLRQSKNVEALTEIESAIVDFGADEKMLAAALNIRAWLAPMSIPAQPKLGGSVSLCMIVKNEQSHLARCLRSVKPLVDEMIVVDTGSSDHTLDIARIFGAKVYDFPWKNDFSKARNFSLSKAAGDWILVLDADETISVKDYEEFRRILKLSQRRPDAYRIQTRNYSNQANTVGFNSNRGAFSEEQGLGWSPSDKVRIFTNDSRIRFAHPVHELVEPSLLKLKIQVHSCSVVVHHYGTLQDDNTLEKTKTYRELGRKKLKKNRISPDAIKESAIQSAKLGKHAEALDLWRRFIRLQPHAAEAYVNIGSACWNLARYAEAVSFAEKALLLDPLLKEAKFNLAISLLLLGRGGEGKAFLERLLGEQPDYTAAQFMLCVAHICMQERPQAEIFFRKLRSLPIGDYIGESFLDISKRFLSASRTDDARLILNTALSFGCETPAIRVLLEECRAAS
jgi:tetratricopeptide (TPR) repeat protein